MLSTKLLWLFFVQLLQKNWATFFSSLVTLITPGMKQPFWSKLSDLLITQYVLYRFGIRQETDPATSAYKNDFMTFVPRSNGGPSNKYSLSFKRTSLLRNLHMCYLENLDGAGSLENVFGVDNFAPRACCGQSCKHPVIVIHHSTTVLTRKLPRV